MALLKITLKNILTLKITLTAIQQMASMKIRFKNMFTLNILLNRDTKDGITETQKLQDFSAFFRLACMR